MRFLFILCITLAFAWTLAADEPTVKPDWLQVPAIKLTLRPADEPSPALKYRLLPSVAELVPGNAVLAYGRANAAEWTRWFYARPELVEREAELAKFRLKELPDRKEWEVFAQLMPEARLREVRRGATSEQCDWDLLGRIRNEGGPANLQDLNSMRNLSQTLAFKARERLATGHVDEALELVKLQFAMARHLTQAPLLFAALSGNGIGQQAVQVLEDCLEQPTCPNLYWSLTNLPRPLVDWRHPLQSEAMISAYMFKELEELTQSVCSPDQFALLLERLMARFQKLFGGSSATPAFRLYLASLVAAEYPSAKAELLRHGRPLAEVERMAMGQVVFLRLMRQKDEWQANMLKWLGLPYVEAEAGLEKLPPWDSRLMIFMYYSYVSPEVLLRLLATAEVLERRLAALRCIEAIRMHAAKTGQLPEKLGDIKCVPVPGDPVLSRPFDYARTANGFSLRAEPFTRVAREEMAKTGKIASNVSLNYEITFTR